MYFSPSCSKDDPKVVARELKNLSSEAMIFPTLKENITMRVRGLSWEWCRHTWSKDGKKYSVQELANHLRWIIKEEINMIFHRDHPSMFQQEHICQYWVIRCEMLQLWMTNILLMKLN